MLVLEVLFSALLARHGPGEEAVRRTAAAVVEKSF